MLLSSTIIEGGKAEMFESSCKSYLVLTSEASS